MKLSNRWKMNPISELRNMYHPYGKFRFSYESQLSVWICIVELNGQEEIKFSKTNLEDVIEDLRTIVESYTSDYVPRYIR